MYRLNSVKRVHFVIVYVTWTIDKCAHMRFTESNQCLAPSVTRNAARRRTSLAR